MPGREGAVPRRKTLRALGGVVKRARAPAEAAIDAFRSEWHT